jgi:hypothetical protein
VSTPAGRYDPGLTIRSAPQPLRRAFGSSVRQSADLTSACPRRTPAFFNPRVPVSFRGTKERHCILGPPQAAPSSSLSQMASVVCDCKLQQCKYSQIILTFTMINCLKFSENSYFPRSGVTAQTSNH